MRRTLSFIFCLFALARPAFGAIADPDVKAQLDERMNVLEESAHKHRLVSGGLLLGTAAVFGGLTVGTAVAGNSGTALPIIFGITGGAAAVAGTLILIFPNEAEVLSAKYRTLPYATPDDLHAKVTAGEVYLESLSDHAHRERILIGAVFCAAGLGEVIGYFVGGNPGSTQYLAYSGAAIATGGLVQLFVERPAETEYANFIRWKEAREHMSRVSELLHHSAFGVMPLPGGGFGSAISFSF
ncbi:MAG: hypothetical protein ACXWPM_04340 [Bdellovibrionota bacterium]